MHPPYRYVCSLQVARKLYELDSYRLPSVAAAAGFIDFAHHDAAADALACAHIMIHAAELVGAKDIAGLAEAASVRVSRAHVTVPESEPVSAEQLLPARRSPDGAYAGAWAMRSMLPDGSRNAQSR